MNKKHLLIALFIFYGAHINAEQFSDYCYETCYYLRAEGGVSFSSKANINVDLTFWDPANEGYNATLGKAALVGAELGFFIRDWLSVGVAINHRSRFNYRKKQTLVTGATTPGVLGDKTRFFDLDNTSFMAILFLNRANWASPVSWELCNVNITPYLGGGIGWSKNVLYNFHSKLNETVIISGVPLTTVASIMSPTSKHSFAGQIQIGIDASICQRVMLGLGYRYFHGGKFHTNDYLVDVISGGATRPVAVPPWTGKLKTHELIASVAIEF